MPPCPKCNSSEHVVPNGSGRVMFRGNEFFNALASGFDLNKGHRCYLCNKCHTIWDTSGGRIQVK